MRDCRTFYESVKLEGDIIRVRVPDLTEILRVQTVSFIQQVRNLDLKKVPSISETIDWARVLVLLHSKELEPDLVKDTLNIFLKFEDDVEIVRGHIHDMTEKAKKEVRG